MARLASASSGHAPTGRSSLPGVAEAELDGVGGVGGGADDPPGHGPLGQEPLVIIQDLLAGVDPQVALSTRSRTIPSVQLGCPIDRVVSKAEDGQEGKAAE
jgi:hypothetical protein